MEVGGADLLAGAIDERKRSIAVVQAKTEGGQPDGSLTESDDMPTAEELATLRRVPNYIPRKIFTIAFIELCERFSYYGTTVVFTNFIQHP